MVKKILKILVLLVVSALIIIQFFRIDKTNPQVVQAETIEASLSMPPDISEILARSCKDCHTNQTTYLWYSNVQPAAWFLKSHIDEGRRKMNFSVWTTYPPKKQAKKLEEICEQLELKEMPLPSYLWLHGDSVLSESDSIALCDWAKLEKAKIDVVIAASSQ